MTEGSSTSRSLYPILGLQQRSSHINNVITCNLRTKADARNCLAILWKIKFEFSGSSNSRSQASCTQREIARQLVSLNYITLYSKSIACPAYYTGLIQVGAKVAVERDKLNVKEVYIVHTKSQYHGSPQIYIILKTVNIHETNCSYWKIAI